jgi:hypothetical protein
MASNLTTAPILFDRALLRARMDRAGRVGPATFLFDRVAEDMIDRLQAVTRGFSSVADIWSPGELPGKPLADRFQFAGKAAGRSISIDHARRIF